MTKFKHQSVLAVGQGTGLRSVIFDHFLVIFLITNDQNTKIPDPRSILTNPGPRPQKEPAPSLT